MCESFCCTAESKKKAPHSCWLPLNITNSHIMPNSIFFLFFHSLYSFVKDFTQFQCGCCCLVVSISLSAYKIAFLIFSASDFCSLHWKSTPFFFFFFFFFHHLDWSVSALHHHQQQQQQQHTVSAWLPMPSISRTHFSLTPVCLCTVVVVVVVVVVWSWCLSH